MMVVSRDYGGQYMDHGVRSVGEMDSRLMVCGDLTYLLMWSDDACREIW